MRPSLRLRRLLVNGPTPNHPLPSTEHCPGHVMSKGSNDKSKSTQAVKQKSILLDRAATDGDLKSVRKLVETGVDVDVRHWFSGFRPLISASASGHPNVVKFLLSKGAGIDLQVSPDYPEKHQHATALMMACLNGHHKVVETLLDAGADVNSNVKDNVYPTALDYAIQGKHLDIVRRLQKAGAVLTPDALTSALLGGEAAIVKELLKNLRREAIPWGSAPLAAAIPVDPTRTDQYLEVLRLSIEAGAEVDSESDGGFTALHKAIKANNPKIVDFLLCAGADVNKAHRLTRETPLHEAAYRGYCECAKVLLEAGAKVDVENHRGRTPLMFAKANKHRDMITLLKQARPSSALRRKSSHLRKK